MKYAIQTKYDEEENHTKKRSIIRIKNYYTNNKCWDYAEEN